MKRRKELMRKIGKKYYENNLAEMLVLMGGALDYYANHNSLNGYDKYYLANREKDGFHYRMQRIADNHIINELRRGGIRCRRWRVKRFYRYKENGNRRVDYVLYDYFQRVMDYILREDVLIKLMFQNILHGCNCSEKVSNKNCLNIILDWQYKRLVQLETEILKIHSNDAVQVSAGGLLRKLESYQKFEGFRINCKNIKDKNE